MRLRCAKRRSSGRWDSALSSSSSMPRSCCCSAGRRGGSMRKPVLLLAVIAAMIVTASIAAPPQTDMTVARGLQLLQSTAVILSLLLAWLLAAVVVTLISAREVRYSSIELRASALHCFALGLVALTSFV